MGSGFFLFLRVFLIWKPTCVITEKNPNTTGADDRTINLQSVLITRALSLKNRSFRLHEHDKMHSSRIVTTHFNQARKNYQMNKFTTKQTLNKNKTRQKSKANKIRHSNSVMWQYLMQNLRKSADLFWAYRAWNYYFFFSDSHLAPKFFKVAANWKKFGRHFQRQTKPLFVLSAF